jgi:hypothetical protein
MSLLTLALLGALIGLPLGYALQRTRLCFNSAYRTAILRRDFSLLRTITLAVVIQMIGLYAFAQFGIGGVSVSVVPFFWMANIVGGFVFGAAMTFAEGCSSTVWYRAGNGNLGALVTLAGFAVGEWVIGTWAPLAAVRGREIAPASGDIATLPNFLGLSPWLVVIPLALAAALWLWRGRNTSRPYGGWDWRVGGLALGVIGAAAWLAAWPTGWHYGVGVVGATGPWVRVLYEGPRVLNWGSFMVAAMPVGALIAALRHGDFKWQIPNLPSTARMTLAGFVMGLSATFAGGCNIGHGFSGLPTLALSSITATLFTFLGAAAGVYWRFVRPQPIRLSPNVPS